MSAGLGSTSFSHSGRRSADRLRQIGRLLLLTGAMLAVLVMVSRSRPAPAPILLPSTLPRALTFSSPIHWRRSPQANPPEIRTRASSSRHSSTRASAKFAG